MARINITLDTRRARKDQTYPVILRVTQNGKSTYVSLGIHVNELYWDALKRQIRKSHPNAQLLNHKILEVRSRLEATLLQSDKQDTSPS